MTFWEGLGCSCKVLRVYEEESPSRAELTALHQTQREIHKRDGVRIQSEQRKRQRLSYGRRNRSTTVGIVVVVVAVYLTLTDSLRIQPWSHGRRNQTKPNREHNMFGEKKQRKQIEGGGQENSQPRTSLPGRDTKEIQIKNK